MSAEWVTAIATVGTFVVIAASAGAALFQLRHMRSGNEIAVLTELRETMESPEFQAALQEIAGKFQERLRDPGFRRLIMSHQRMATIDDVRSAVFIGNFFETAGALVKNRIIDADLFCDLLSNNVVGAWECLDAFIANRRLVAGPALFENFEYLVTLCERYNARYPNGTFAHSSWRKQMPETWPESAEYVKS